MRNNNQTILANILKRKTNPGWTALANPYPSISPEHQSINPPALPNLRKQLLQGRPVLLRRLQRLSIFTLRPIPIDHSSPIRSVPEPITKHHVAIIPQPDCNAGLALKRRGPVDPPPRRRTVSEMPQTRKPGAECAEIVAPARAVRCMVLAEELAAARRVCIWREIRPFVVANRDFE